MPIGRVSPCPVQAIEYLRLCVGFIRQVPCRGVRLSGRFRRNFYIFVKVLEIQVPFHLPRIRTAFLRKQRALYDQHRITER